MMFRKIEDFVQNWTYESAATQKLMDELTDASLAQAVTGDHRTLGRLAWHIITTIPEMMPLTGLKLPAIDPKAPVPATADEIKKAYATVSGELLDQVKASWQDEDLQVEDDLYGEKWQRGITLLILIKHEVHHRGQMTVLMRQAGLPVKGVYGPAMEEWANFGGQPPEV
jgi:uncharacterized damage-inducible protein DinB